MDINFHNSRQFLYLPLPDWISSKKVGINPKNEEDEECFKWAILAALHQEQIDSHPEQISKLRRFEDNYDWRGLGFSIAFSKIALRLRTEQQCFCECLDNRRTEKEALHSQKG